MIAFSIWSIHIYRYGIMYMISFLLWYAGLVRWQQRGWYKNYPFIDQLIAKNIDGLIIAILLWVMVGGRVGHVLIYDLSYFIAHPAKILAYSEWGMSFIGGIIGTIVSVSIFYGIKYKVESTKSFVWHALLLLDTLMPFIPLGIIFGRLGNFLNQELYGVIVPQDFRHLPSWIINFCQTTQIFYVYDRIGPELRLNTNFLSIFFEWLLIAIVVRYYFLRYWVSKRFGPWQLSAIWLGCYSLVRFLFEYLRQDSQAEFVGWFTKSQWFFVIFTVVAIGVLVGQRRKLEG